MSIKRNVQAFREWAYENNFFKREQHTEPIITTPVFGWKKRKLLKIAKQEK